MPSSTRCRANEWCSLRLRLPPRLRGTIATHHKGPGSGCRCRIRVVGHRAKSPIGEGIVSGRAKPRHGRTAGGPACAVIFPAPGIMATTEALVTWAPTERFADGVVRAPAGDWQIAVRSRSGSNEAIHFYIARNQTNPDALPAAGRPSSSTTASMARDRHLRAPKDDPDPPQSPIRRRGTLNSLATGACGKGAWSWSAALTCASERVPGIRRKVRRPAASPLAEARTSWRPRTVIVCLTRYRRGRHADGTDGARQRHELRSAAGRARAGQR